jgi:hypothetical protein
MKLYSRLFCESDLLDEIYLCLSTLKNSYPAFEGEVEMLPFLLLPRPIIFLNQKGGALK